MTGAFEIGVTIFALIFLGAAIFLLFEYLDVKKQLDACTSARDDCGTALGECNEAKDLCISKKDMCEKDKKTCQDALKRSKTTASKTTEPNKLLLTSKMTASEPKTPPEPEPKEITDPPEEKKTPVVVGKRHGAFF